MRYLCTKQLTVGGEIYYPGEIIPDGVILPRRSGKLEKSGYISKLSEQAEGKETGLSECGDAVLIAVYGDGNTGTALWVSPEEIQQIFRIMQLNAEEGIKAIADITSEHVLILLHAADSRKTIKNAAKEQADKLFSTEGVSNESSKGNETTDTNTEGADT